MKRHGTIILLFLQMVFIAGRSTAGNAEKLVERVEKAIQNTNTMEIVFEERFVWKMTGEESSLQGTLIMAGNDRFRVETEDQILVSDGVTLWTYSKPSNRVLIDKLANTDEALLPRQLLLKYTDGYTARQLASETIDGQEYEVLLFTDKTEQSFYVKWQVWIDPATYLPKKLMQEDLNGNQNVYFLESIKSGVSLNSDVFTFQIPEGADIIEM